MRAPGRCEANFRPSRGVGAGRSHFAPRAVALGRGEAIFRPGWGVGAGRGHFAPRAGALGRGAYVFWALWCAPRPGALPASRGACTAPVITNMKFENIFLLIFFTKKEVRNWKRKYILLIFTRKRSKKFGIFQQVHKTLIKLRINPPPSSLFKTYFFFTHFLTLQ